MRFHQFVTLPRLVLLAVLWTVPTHAAAASFPSQPRATIEQLASGPTLLHAGKTRRPPKAKSRPATRAPSRRAPARRAPARMAPTKQKTTVCCPRCSTCRKRAARNGVRVK